MLSFFRDGFKNVVANLGTPRDKASAGTWVAPTLSGQDAITIYRASALARKLVNIPANDACREWRSWQGPAKMISLIEAEEARHGVKKKVRSALRAARLLGGAAIYIGADTANQEEPLNLNRIGLGGLNYISLVRRSLLTAEPFVTDISSPYFGIPEFWRINGAVDQRIHASRLLIFKGAEIPDDGYSSTGNFGWADSILASCIDPLRNHESGAANAASLIHEAKVDVLRISGMADGLASVPGYEEALLQRIQLTGLLKGTNGMIVADALDDYSSKSASFGGLPDLMDRFALHLSAAADIPMTRLFGQSPAGLSSTGESDLRNYYDEVRSRQTMDIEPILATLDEALIRSALGSRPEEVYFNWNPLWQVSSSEIAQIGKTIAETFSSLNSMDIGIPEEALAAGVVNALTEAGAAPGLESEIKKYTFGPDAEEDDEDWKEVL